MTRDGARIAADELQVVVPSTALPASVSVDRSNNNLDVAVHDGRWWLAWRTAPSHFASAAARIQVVSSEDRGRRWRHERTIAPGRDLREPRFYVWEGRLHLTWFTAGTKATAFEPDRVWLSRLEVDGWSDAEPVGPPDTVVWRVRPVGDHLVMSVYRHAATLFGAHPRPLEVELWTSGDGMRWARPERPDHVGGSETELLDLGDGHVLFVIRKEGPHGGWGADLALARGHDLAGAELVHDHRKLDSPLLFAHDGRPHLVTRRQLAFRGRYDLGLSRLSDVVRTRVDQVAYSLTPKRTALYRVELDGLGLVHLGDLPSAGDTAFAAQMPLDDGRHLLWNYSSPPAHGRWPWLVGQLRPTHIYAVPVELT